MKKVGVIINTKRARADLILNELKKETKRHGFQLFVEREDMAKLLDATLIPTKRFASEVDVVLAMGGDGTVLYTARAIHGSDIPIMGINLGSLGFLTGVSDSEIAIAMTTLAEGTYKKSVRDVAECTIAQGDTLLGNECALNDIVIGWGATSRIVTFKVLVDEYEVGTFMCDGMMVSTPTGSTGHSLSAGGPILHPEIGGFTINAICPHTLSARPLVVPTSSKIELQVANAAKELIVSVDGQDNFKIARNGRIVIERSPHKATFLQLQNHNYFSVLSQKLHWRGSSI